MFRLNTSVLFNLNQHPTPVRPLFLPGNLHLSLCYILPDRGAPRFIVLFVFYDYFRLASGCPDDRLVPVSLLTWKLLTALLLFFFFLFLLLFLAEVSIPNEKQKSQKKLQQYSKENPSIRNVDAKLDKYF